MPAQFHPAGLLSFSETDRSPLSIRARALVFIDPRSRQLRDQVESLAPARQPLLIRGESGTGKELLARHVHKHSERSGLFVAVNGGALSKAHGAAELFGHSAGYPAGPSSRAGWLGSAQGGTLYLDEIADLPLSLQQRLLEVLQQGAVWREGASQAQAVDVRLIAASSLDLALAVRAGKFNAALFELLQAGQVDLPALRQRPGDILALAEYFLGVYSQRLELPLPLLSEAAEAALQAYHWPGNTRELENVVHFALLVSQGQSIRADDLQIRGY
ncbi:sigma-54-dependent transcriptional regulator [Pseudomonas sp. N040]|uniref:sigma-54-dependent transcriptional regulator n=1 Tax=Pseudomonas sp. N040 TaxID=2785325 RepID=UPI0018A2C205|nr:sigma 54-interacting transcriptional regulator [Pseudomonas sp. N040]MBF7729048.1 sigma-54-dependent Fis family transcriptional regulator [Pseudomonas sp. N040]MBW7012688.1 sigma 54-interacting transcriptional regulator [Pseudomonas sp. N040]